MPSEPTFYYKNNRLQQLRGFYYAATLKSITKAAELLHLTQPSISLQIKSLERDLETQLFNRKGPAISLTEDGMTLLKLITPIIEGVTNLKDNFQTLRTEKNNTQLNIAANQATVLYLLPKILKNFTSHSPEIKVKIHAAVAMEGVDKLRNGQVDLIVGPPSFDIPDDCVYHPLFYYDPVLITRPDHPLAGKRNVKINEICQYPLILPPPHLRTIKNIDDLFIEHNIPQPHASLEFDGWEIIRKYVELEMAITIALSLAVEDDPVLVGTKLNHYFPASSYGVILRRGKLLSPIAQEFITSIDPSFTFETHFQ
jgi:DNA-binding transcriptional LysR family regulator